MKKKSKEDALISRYNGKAIHAQAKVAKLLHKLDELEKLEVSMQTGMEWIENELSLMNSHYNSDLKKKVENIKLKQIDIAGFKGEILKMIMNQNLFYRIG